MKFSLQVASYLRSLKRKSRLFSMLMLLSGLSLAVAAPFLSYEVSQIECYEKGGNITQEVSGELDALKNLMGRKDQRIGQLEKEVKNKEEELREVLQNPDCNAIVRVIEAERKELEDEILQLRQEVIENERVISQLGERLIKCQEESEGNSNQQGDCERYIDLVGKMRIQLAAKDKTIAELRNNQQPAVSCPATLISGTLLSNTVLSFNGQQFLVSVNTDDVGRSFVFNHNKKPVYSVTTTKEYSFKDKNGNGYRLNITQVIKKTRSVTYAIRSL